MGHTQGSIGDAPAFAMGTVPPVRPLFLTRHSCRRSSPGKPGAMSLSAAKALSQCRAHKQAWRVSRHSFPLRAEAVRSPIHERRNRGGNFAQQLLLGRHFLGHAQREHLLVCDEETVGGLDARHLLGLGL